MDTPDISAQWKALNPEQRNSALSRMNPEQKLKLATALGYKKAPVIPPGVATIGPSSGPLPEPKTSSKDYGGVVEDARQHTAKFLTDNAPSVLGAVGGAVTGGMGFIPALLGAGAGGFIGGKAQGKNTGQAGVDAAKQVGYEAGGRVAGRAVAKALTPIATRFAPEIADAAEKYPILKVLTPKGDTSKKAVDYLTAAGGPDTHKAIAATIGDIEKGMESLPPGKRTIGSFLDAVNAAKDSMNQESGKAMMLIGNKETVPQPVIENLEKLITPNMDKTAQGRAEKSAIKRAITEFQKPWTYGELDAERMTTRARLNAFHAKESVAQYSAQKASRSLAIDNAIEQGLKDTIYPEMDRATNVPRGTYADMKGRQSNLIQLESLLNKRIEQLAGKSSEAAGSPRLSSENLSVSLHPGTAPRIGLYSLRNAVKRPDVLESAGKRVGKAFLPPELSAQPYQVILGAAARMYKHNAKNAQGHRIGSDDGVNWFDSQTGQQTHSGQQRVQ